MLPLIGVLASVVPSLISAVAGDKAGKVAGQVAEVAKAILGTDNPVDAEKALSTLPPDKLVDLKLGLAKIAADAEAVRSQATLDTLRAELADVANARAQTVDLAKSGNPIAWGAPIVSVLIVLGYFLLLYVLLAEPLPQVSSNWKDLLLVLFGALQIAFGQVANYWLGSSAGSDRKSALLAQAPSIK